MTPASWTSDDNDLSFTVAKTKFHDPVSGDELFIQLHHQHHFDTFGFKGGHHDFDDSFFFSVSFGFGDSFIDLHHRHHFRTFGHRHHDHFRHHFGIHFGHSWCHDDWWPHPHFHHSSRFFGSRVFVNRFHGSFHSVTGCSCHWRWRFSSGWWSDPWWYEPCLGSRYGACYSDYASYSWAAPSVSYASYLVPAPVMTFTQAWDLLSSGDFHAALDGFSQLLTAGVELGPARIGYSLALGLLGRHEAASRSMRLAIVDEPDAIAQMSVNGQLHGYLQVLLGEYIDFARSRRNEMDALFMIAALRFMVHQDAEAYFAIDSAIRGGDTQDSTLLLRSIIDETLQDAIYQP